MQLMKLFTTLVGIINAASAIPAAETVTAELSVANDASPAKIFARDSTSCGGSAACGILNVTPGCLHAYEQYDDNTWYTGYTSRVSGHCTAVYSCDSQADYGGGWPGSFLKQKFSTTYDICNKNKFSSACGSTFFWASCRAKLDYCSDCLNEG
ncbi:hypothetical protein N431DRAFT_445832 [Stipitochalara longipes BDJ]|nr:hypothetical protein N431DRAFT_445832 [Stipitochalara longipes BDJ]